MSSSTIVVLACLILVTVAKKFHPCNIKGINAKRSETTTTTTTTTTITTMSTTKLSPTTTVKNTTTNTVTITTTTITPATCTTDGPASPISGFIPDISNIETSESISHRPLAVPPTPWKHGIDDNAAIHDRPINDSPDNFGVAPIHAKSTTNEPFFQDLRHGLEVRTATQECRERGHMGACEEWNPAIICQKLRCQTVDGFTVSIGPAPEHTPCGEYQICVNAKCLHIQHNDYQHGSTAMYDCH